MMLIGVLLRAPLMVVAFFIAYELMGLMVHLFNKLFTFEQKAMMAEVSLSGIITIIAMIYLYVLTIIVMEHKIFGLITWLPDNVLNWAGTAVGGNQLGHQAEQSVRSVDISATCLVPVMPIRTLCGR